MTIKYNKRNSKQRKLVVYSIIGGIALVANIASLVCTLISSASYSSIITLNATIASFVISCISILYCIVQDICQTSQTPPDRFVFKNKKDIPFVDREELIEEVLRGISQKIIAHQNYYSKSIRYGVRNGKTAFAERVCAELQEIKNKRGRGFCQFDPKVASKFGNIILVDYTTYKDSFEMHIKSDYVYIRGKINLVVVTNVRNQEFPWSENLKDPDIFFVLLNFNNISDDALLFQDDKIVELLHELQSVPSFAPLLQNKSKKQIDFMAEKLGRLSHNNIGTIVDLLTSNDFSLLMEMDASFVEFYLALRQGQYAKATKLYADLPLPPPQNKALEYKTRYEKANLDHFLGKYNDAYESLVCLLAEICNKDTFMNSNIGKAMYFDIILLQSHILKHLGRFEDSINTLQQVGTQDQNAVWLRAHFSVTILRLNELIQPSAEWGTLLRNLESMMEQFRNARKLVNSSYYYYETYHPIVEFYLKRFDRALIPSLIRQEEKAIVYYEVEERRYLTNCYFIKAEFLRISEQWREAEQYYTLCYDICTNNGDKDILYLIAITCKCLQQFENVHPKIPLDCDNIISECKQQEGYGFHHRIISTMELAIENAEYRGNWLAHYRSTITPIP